MAPIRDKPGHFGNALRVRFARDRAPYRAGAVNQLRFIHAKQAKPMALHTFVVAMEKFHACVQLIECGGSDAQHPGCLAGGVDGVKRGLSEPRIHKPDSDDATTLLRYYDNTIPILATIGSAPFATQHSPCHEAPPPPPLGSLLGRRGAAAT